MKGKTNLLEYKNNDCGSNTNSMHGKNPKENVINETPTKLDQKLYETLLVFHSDKFTEKMKINKNKEKSEIKNNNINQLETIAVDQYNTGKKENNKKINIIGGENFGAIKFKDRKSVV